MSEETPHQSESPEGRESGLGDLAAKLLRVSAEAVSSSAEKIREKGEGRGPKEVLSGAVNLTAKGKDELYGILAGEVRTYLNKLKVDDAIRKLLTEHSLEVSASVRLKPVAREEADEAGETRGEEGLGSDTAGKAKSAD